MFPGQPHGTFYCSLGSWILDSKGKSCPVPFLKIPNVCYLFSLIPPCGLPSISKDLRAKKNLSQHLVQLSYTWWNGGQERANVGQQSQNKKNNKRKKRKDASQLSGSASCSLLIWTKVRMPQQLEHSLWSWTDFSLNLKSSTYVLCDPEQFNLLVYPLGITYPTSNTVRMIDEITYGKVCVLWIGSAHKIFTLTYSAPEYLPILTSSALNKQQDACSCFRHVLKAGKRDCLYL